MADSRETIVTKLRGYQGPELSACDRDDIPGAHIVTIYLRVVNETAKFLRVLIT